MTDYAGEGIRLRAADVTDFDGRALTPADIDTATVTIWNFDFTDQVLAPTTLPFDNVADTWAYVWDTTGVDAGTYMARLLFVTVDGLESFEFKRVRLRADPSA